MELVLLCTVDAITIEFLIIYYRLSINIIIWISQHRHNTSTHRCRYTLWSCKKKETTIVYVTLAGRRPVFFCLIPISRLPFFSALTIATWKLLAHIRMYEKHTGCPHGKPNKKQTKTKHTTQKLTKSKNAYITCRGASFFFFLFFYCGKTSHTMKIYLPCCNNRSSLPHEHSNIFFSEYIARLQLRCLQRKKKTVGKQVLSCTPF